MPDAGHMIVANGTPRQAQALMLIRPFIAEYGREPTGTELGRAMTPPIRPQSAARLLDKLRAAGKLTPPTPEAQKLRALLADVRAFLRPLAVCQGDRLALGALVARIDAALGEG
jgi:SOS-response transcriptional repressor LexA